MQEILKVVDPVEKVQKMIDEQNLASETFRPCLA